MTAQPAFLALIVGRVQRHGQADRQAPPALGRGSLDRGPECREISNTGSTGVSPV